MTGAAACKGDTVYTILDPTGNITALAEGPTDPFEQMLTAGRIMERHREVEQVGFLSNPEEINRMPLEFRADWPFFPDGTYCDLYLRMAGGEFCGNASMCAAALWFLNGTGDLMRQESAAVTLGVSGVSGPVKVHIIREGAKLFRAGVCMPPALSVEYRPVYYRDKAGELPVVQMEGISHLIVSETSVFAALKNDNAAAEEAVRLWCGMLGVKGLGIMFLEEDRGETGLTPLVYIPGSGTCFWENSCASGSAAAGMYQAYRTGHPVELTFREPGGMLKVESDPKGETWLWGHVRVEEEYRL